MILTREAFENAIVVTIALGGSTNAVLHLLAIAHAADVPLQLDDFTRIGKRVPVLADLRPSGRYSMSELIRIGGIQPLMKSLLDAGFLHGDCLTVTGKTLRQNLARVKPYPQEQDIVRPLTRPIKSESHLVILYGNLAPEGAVAKISGKEGLQFTGRARVFEGEEAALQAILDGTVLAGDVVVVRYEGPRGRTGHARDAEPDRRDHGQGPGRQGGADHRRTLLRRQPRLRRGTRVARGGAGRPAGAGARRRRHRHRRDHGGSSRCSSAQPSWRSDGRSGSRARPMPRAACWRSTRHSSAARRSGRSPTVDSAWRRHRSRPGNTNSLRVNYCLDDYWSVKSARRRFPAVSSGMRPDSSDDALQYAEVVVPATVCRR